MSEQNINIDLIEAFLNHELDEAGMNAFRKRLEDEPDLKLEVERFQLARKGVMNHGLKLKLQEIHSDIQELESDQKPPLNWRWVAGIAASLVLVATTYFLLLPDKSSEDLFLNYFIAYPSVEIKRGSNVSNQEFLALYDMGKYDGFLEKAKPGAIENDTLRLLVANAFIKTGKFTEAKKQLSAILNQSPLYASAQWYTALLMVRDKKVDNALKILSSDVIKKSEYQAKAVELLTELNNLD